MEDTSLAITVKYIVCNNSKIHRSFKKNECTNNKACLLYSKRRCEQYGYQILNIHIVCKLQFDCLTPLSRKKKKKIYVLYKTNPEINIATVLRPNICQANVIALRHFVLIPHSMTIPQLNRMASFIFYRCHFQFIYVK